MRERRRKMMTTAGRKGIIEENEERWRREEGEM